MKLKKTDPRNAKEQKPSHWPDDAWKAYVDQRGEKAMMVEAATEAGRRLEAEFKRHADAHAVEMQLLRDRCEKLEQRLAESDIFASKVAVERDELRRRVKLLHAAYLTMINSIYESNDIFPGAK